MQSPECSGARRCSIKRQPPHYLTHCWDQCDRQREMEEVTAVGKGTTFFLLLVLAASTSATSLNTTQQNTAITATSGKQVKRVCVCVCFLEPKTLHTLNQCGNTYNTHHTTACSHSTEKGYSVLSFEGLHIQQCWGDVDGWGRG